MSMCRQCDKDIWCEHEHVLSACVLYGNTYGLSRIVCVIYGMDSACIFVCWVCSGSSQRTKWVGISFSATLYILPLFVSGRDKGTLCLPRQTSWLCAFQMTILIATHIADLQSFISSVRISMPPA